MLAPFTLGILNRANALLIPRPAGARSAPAPASAAAPPREFGRPITRQDFQSLPVRLGADEASELIPAHALDIRYPDLWHGMLAAPEGARIPDQEGFHPGTSPAIPRAILAHPEIRYLRRDVLYVPYLRESQEDFLLCLPYRGRKHLPFLVGIDGLVLPYVYVCEPSAPLPIFPGDPARSCGLAPAAFAKDSERSDRG